MDKKGWSYGRTKVMSASADNDKPKMEYPFYFLAIFAGIIIAIFLGFASSMVKLLFIMVITYWKYILGVIVLLLLARKILFRGGKK